MVRGHARDREPLAGQPRRDLDHGGLGGREAGPELVRRQVPPVLGAARRRHREGQRVRAGLIPEAQLHLDGDAGVGRHGHLRERPRGQDDVAALQADHPDPLAAARERERRQHESARAHPNGPPQPHGHGTVQRRSGPGHRSVTTSSGHGAGVHGGSRRPRRSARRAGRAGGASSARPGRGRGTAGRPAAAGAATPPATSPVPARWPPGRPRSDRAGARDPRTGARRRSNRSRVRRGELDHHRQQRVIRERDQERHDVRRVVGDVVADHDVGQAAPSRRPPATDRGG